MLSYGCWCNLYKDRKHARKGLGRPLDAFDIACQHWQQCHQCTQMDDTDCTPLLVPYDLSFKKTINSYGITKQEVSCDKASDGCAHWNCQCDANLAKQMVTLVMRGEFDPRNVHSNPEFDASRQCEWTGNYETHDECCGTYPLRFPFSTGYGNRACCMNKTYNTAEGICCDDGVVSGSGSCNKLTTQSSTTSTPSVTRKLITLQKATYDAMTNTNEMTSTLPTTTPTTTTTTTTTTSTSLMTTLLNKYAVLGSDKMGICNRRQLGGFEKLRILELVIIIDVSGSMTDRGLLHMWSWLSEFIGSFETQRSVKIAIILFAADIDLEMSLNHYSSDQINKKIMELKARRKTYSQNGSSLNIALKTARQELKTGGMEKADRVILVITDGWSTEDKTPLFHSQLAAKGYYNYELDEKKFSRTVL